MTSLIDDGNDSGSTVECLPVLDGSDRLRQGDVIEWITPLDMWSRHAIVVTADCDLVRSKHAGAVALVPVLRYDEYFAAFVLPGKLHKECDKVVRRARDLARSLHARYRADRPSPLSDTAIDDWIATTPASAILKTLAATDADEAEQFSDLVEWIQGLEKVCEGENLEAQLRAQGSARRMLGGRQTVADLTRESLQQVKTLPGDALFLHSIGPSLTEGYVVYIRRITSVDERRIALLTSDLRDREMSVKRIARLNSPYVYRLTQQLGQVFSDIGLPRSYEDSRSRFIDEQTARLGSIFD